MSNKNTYEGYTLLLGKGFALNVYLPALIAINSKNIALEASSKNLIKTDTIYKNIKWLNDNEIINNKFSKIIIAEPPEKQFKLICDISLWKNSNKIILEKPLAENHKKATYLIDILNKNKIRYSINYTFRYTKWNKKIYKYLQQNTDKSEISIHWKFNGRHLQKKESTWKTNHLLGGGAIKYYGIHLIAILSDMGYTDVEKTDIFNQPLNKLNSWYCKFNSINQLPKLNLYIDSNSNENKFYWNQLNKNLLKIDNPFSLESSKYNGDKRIPPTIKFLQEEHTNLFNLKNMNILKLWSKIESKLGFY
tara:strand:- start:229 stop:1146 length:918 start_codon:yes stop_codon:yes gene_type:complete